MDIKQPLKQTLGTLKANRKRLFWAWIAYHSIKGAITLSIVWIPLLLWWLKG